MKIEAQSSKMPDTFIVVLNLINEKSIQVPIHVETSVEEAIIFVCKKLDIKPITRHLFGLCYDRNQWASLSTKLIEFRVHNFELRIRYKVPESIGLANVDKQAFNYFFYQVRHDLITNKMEERIYDEHKEDFLGLSVVDMYRVMLETGMKKEEMLEDYKKYIPKNVANFHRLFLKKPIKQKLAGLEQSMNKSTTKLKQIYLQRFEDMIPDYMTETYNAKIDEGINEREIVILVHPFHKEMPGVQYQYVGKDVWNHLCTFDDLCCVSLHPDGKAEISRKNGIPVYLKMNNNSLVSFITLLDGYYRLSIKWTFNLCKDFITPSLQILQTLKCHGPVGQEFALKKLEEKRRNKPGCFILRECETSYDCYAIDVCNSSKKVYTYKIEHRGEGHYWFSGDEDSYASVATLIAKYRSPVSKIPMLECIPPSEYDISSLLLCRLEVQSETGPKGHTVTEQMASQIIHWKHLSICPGVMYEGRYGLTEMRRYMWRNKNSKSEVAVKSLKLSYREYYLPEFLDLAGKWALIRSSSVVRLLGITIAGVVSMVSEFFPLGPLDYYLQQHKSEIEEVDLVEAATYIASALWYMEGEGIVHGYIRCRKILVASHTENSFSVKLLDPGLHPSVAENDWHWIPPELYDSPSDVPKNISADVWAFGTTLWELFSYGEKPSVPFLSIKDFYGSGKRLAQPNKCSIEMYYLMTECWHVDPDHRKKPQAAMRDINQLLYQVHNARRCHSYAAAKPRLDSVDTLNDVSSTALEENSEITSQRTTMSTVDSSRFDFNSSLDFNSSDAKIKVNWFGKTPLFSVPTIDDNQSICSTSSVQSIILNDFKIVIQGSIGKGFYGEVYKGYMENPDTLDVQYVAVKKLITDKPSCLTDFEREIVIMKNLKHPNIVAMIGVIQHPEISLIMEYVPQGSLKCYLNTHKDQLEHSRLLKYSMDVAQGMEYLGQQKIVHRDLAARNVLVQDEEHVKISDFGLAQRMDHSNYYMLKTPRELPLRWYAPESLRDGKFSKFSDVWSYGVLLYEMFSFGGDPVIANEGSDQKSLLEVLDTGARLSCPPTCPVEVYSKLMIPCWKMKEKDRPTFGKIIQLIHSMH